MFPAFLFYWYYVVLTATAGGKIYATGDWRLPLSGDDFGDRIETRWVIAGTEGRSSCYAWVQPDEGYRFVGFKNSNDEWVCDGDHLNEIRLWATTESAQQEDGIVSGNDFYPTEPVTYTAVFVPDEATQIAAPHKADPAPQLRQQDDAFDLSGRRISTPRHGQIIIRNRKKTL